MLVLSYCQKEVWSFSLLFFTTSLLGVENLWNVLHEVRCVIGLLLCRQ